MPLKNKKTPKKKPEISIIIPVYRVEEYLPACLNSILKQTFKDFEVLCVNDGSPDRCGEILKEYSQKDKRIKVINQENQGVSIARNTGLKNATGTYICFVDSDDTLAPTFLEKMYHIIQSEKVDIVSCDIYQGDSEPKWEESLGNLNHFNNPFEAYIQENLKTYAAIWGKLYTKKVLSHLTFEKIISQGGEDLFYLYQALYQAKKLAFTSEKLYFYRERPNSVMTSKLSKRFVLGNIKTAELMFLYFSDKKLSSLTRKILNQKIAKRIFKFAVLEPKRKDKENLDQWYNLTAPVLKELKEKNIYHPQYLNFKNRFKSWFFLRETK